VKHTVFQQHYLKPLTFFKHLNKGHNLDSSIFIAQTFGISFLSHELATAVVAAVRHTLPATYFCNILCMYKTVKPLVTTLKNSTLNP
jgi:hypothetical protein